MTICPNNARWPMIVPETARGFRHAPPQATTAPTTASSRSAYRVKDNPLGVIDRVLRDIFGR